jgi:hypothetical protein
MMFACSSEDNSQSPVVVSDRTILQIEEFSSAVETTTLEWLLVTLEDDFGAAASLVAKDEAAWSDNGLPTLTYAIDFTEPGQYALSLRGRRDSRFISDHPVHLVFGADQGDIDWAVSGLDDQWNWYEQDDSGQQMLINVDTAGVHELRISSAAEGLLLDQLNIASVSATRPASNTEAATEDNIAGEQNTQVSEDNTGDQSASESEPQIQTNQAPVASIAADSTVAAGTALGLAINATDDGKPHGGIYYYWTKTSGFGTAQFSAVQSQVTSVIFDLPGKYTVQATVSDGERYINVLHNITVTGADTSDTQTDASQGSIPRNDNQQQNASDNNSNNNRSDNLPAGYRWHSLATKGKVTPRHETGGVVVNGKLYVIGGRGNRPVEVYDPQSNRWQKISNAPIEMHHFQPVAVGSKIYIVGAFTCCYPREDIIEDIYIFDTNTHRWSKGPKLPSNRKRGSAGAVVYNNKIYLIGGNTRGHSGGAVSWFDEFDPRTGKWKTLRNAPDARDHVTVAVVDSKLVVAGGRKTNTPIPFANTVGRTNVYDFRTGRWSNEANIPTQRAGTMTVAVGDEVVVIGGESTAGTGAHRNVEAFNVNTGRWRSLDDLRTARHGGAAGVLNGVIHVVAGNTKRGGGRETSDHEVLK